MPFLCKRKNIMKIITQESVIAAKNYRNPANTLEE
jgi:hypothetical protein